ncbi:MAG: hypothetical protein LBD80_04500 [Tannerella sp.]|jgi:hypothetical protein|nr:hypothetical protein [Tannerella sp.]
MKKHVRLFIALVLSAGMLAIQGLSAQKRAVKVQGHLHKLLTDKDGGKEDATTTTRKAVSTRQVDTTWINPANVQCWIDQPKLDPNATDSAILIIKFTDRKSGLDSMYVWGYRWNAYSIFADPVTGEPDTTYANLHGIDMLRSVVVNDMRLSALLQYAGAGGHLVGGLGVNMYDYGTACYRMDLDFDIYNAQHDVPDSVWFSYFEPNEYCDEGQTAVPLSANNSTNMARTDYKQTGVLVHPFGAEYGQSAEDFDFWNLDAYPGPAALMHWQSGWMKNGFWGYYRADNWRVPVPSSNPNIYLPDPEAAQYGVTYEPLQRWQVHAFVFRPRIQGTSQYDYQYELHYFDGAFKYMDCYCAPCPQNVTGKKE